MAKPNTPISQLSESDKLRFFSRVSTVPTDKGCLEWTAGKFNTGYGCFWDGERNIGSHRIAYFLATGIDPLELDIRHSCHNPACNNPIHLSIGTHQDNMDDRQRAGRTACGGRSGRYTRPDRTARGSRNGRYTCPERTARGERQGNAKLTAGKVIAIRSDSRTLKKIALDYSVSQVLISKIKRRKLWAHVA